MIFFNLKPFKNKYFRHFSFIYIACIILSSSGLLAQTTQSVDFKVTTSSPNGKYNPRNIGAIWIEDVNGNFIKTINVWAKKRKKYLYTWNVASKGNVVDALTGATLSSHKTHNVSWNLKDVSDNTVPNGMYQLKIELTDKHSQGPLATFSFPVGEVSNVTSLPDQTYFHNIELSWTSTVTTITDKDKTLSQYRLYQNYPNPFNPTTQIRYVLPQGGKVVLSVYNIMGQKTATLVKQYQNAGKYSVQFNASVLASGVYIYKISTKNFTQTKKMFLLR